ncbi:hypothetical protein CsatB_029484 [Cannabis sativa]
MMNLKFQKANLLGIELSREQWVHFILNSLPPEYNGFVVSYMINNFNSSDMDKLEAELRAYEQNLPAKGPPPRFANLSKRKRIKYEASNNAASSSAIDGNTLQCSNCNEKGHQEERCPRLLNNSNEAA